MKNNILVLQVYTTVDLDLIKNEMATIVASIKRWTKWIREHRLQSFVVITTETPLELRERLYDVIVGKPGIGGLYCFTAPVDLVGSYADLEALRFHIDSARVQIREWDRANDMRKDQRLIHGRKGRM